MVSSGQRAGHLQVGDWDLEGGAGKGHQHEPEDESANGARPKGEQGDHPFV
jgi:hypothetical protein